MEQIRWLFIFRAGSPGAENGVVILKNFCLYKKVAESRMRLVGGLTCQYHLTVTCNLKDFNRLRSIRDFYSSHLCIIFRRDNDLCFCLQTVILPMEFYMTLREDGFVFV